MASDYATLAAAFPWLFPALAFLAGIIIGSFLNVCIYRIPKEQSIVTPGSRCACGQPIRWHDNVPLLSWLLLRGQARCCGRVISARYPLVELLTGLLFLLCWMLFPPVKALCGWVLVSGLICATFIDLDHLIIPNGLTIGGALVGGALSLLAPSLHGYAGPVFLVDALRSGIDSLQGALIGSGLVLWIALVAEAILKKDAMGFGDVKFVGAIGAFCGWQGAVFAVFGGAVIGTVCYGLVLLWRRGRRTPPPSADAAADAEPAVGFSLGAHVPFGPMLSVAGLLYFFVAHRWIDVYFAEFAALLR